MGFRVSDLGPGIQALESGAAFIARFLSSALLPFVLKIRVPLLNLSKRKKDTLSIKGLLRNLDSILKGGGSKTGKQPSDPKFSLVLPKVPLESPRIPSTLPP